MHAVMEKDVQLVTTTLIPDPHVLATLVVLDVNPARSPIVTTRIAGRSAIWTGWPVPIDEEPTWEDAAWQ